MKLKVFIFLALILASTAACTSIEVGQVMTLQQGAVLREDFNSFAGVGNYSQGCVTTQELQVIILDTEESNYGSSHVVGFAEIETVTGEDFSCEEPVDFQTYWVNSEYLN
jgi:hypothetical protein